MARDQIVQRVLIALGPFVVIGIVSMAFWLTMQGVSDQLDQQNQLLQEHEIRLEGIHLQLDEMKLRADEMEERFTA